MALMWYQAYLLLMKLRTIRVVCRLSLKPYVHHQENGQRDGQEDAPLLDASDEDFFDISVLRCALNMCRQMVLSGFQVRMWTVLVGTFKVLLLTRGEDGPPQPGLNSGSNNLE